MTINYKFWNDRADKRVRNAEFNNLVLSNNNYVINDCAVTSAGSGLDVSVASGAIFIDNSVVTYDGGTITLIARDATHERCDLILLNSSGVLSKVDGTPSISPVTPPYDEIDYVIVAFVIVNNGTTEVLTDSEIANIGIQNKNFFTEVLSQKLINGNYQITSEDTNGNILSTETITRASFKSLDTFVLYSTNSWTGDGADGIIGTESGNFVDTTNTTKLTITDSAHTSFITTTHDFGDLSDYLGASYTTGYVDILVKLDTLASVSNFALVIGSDNTGASDYVTMDISSASIYFPKNNSTFVGLRFDVSGGATTGTPSGNLTYIELDITTTGNCVVYFRELNILVDSPSTTVISGETFNNMRRYSNAITNGKTIPDDIFYDSDENVRNEKISEGY